MTSRSGGAGPVAGTTAVQARTAHVADDDPAEPRNLKDIAEKLVELSRRILQQADHDDRARSATPAQPAAPLPAWPDVVDLHGAPAINAAIRTSLSCAGSEILTAQPDGARPKEVLDVALESVRLKIDDGVSMRTIYQHSARFDEATKSYVRAVTGYGVKVRTLPEFFDRLIIIDRATAFIPANAERSIAAAITEPSVVRFLVDVFERSWDRAEPFPFIPNYAAQAASEVITPIRAAIRQLLAEGHSDKAIARRLGISERSLQAHIAHIKKRLGAKNRTHLGYLLCQTTHGTEWPGAEPGGGEEPPGEEPSEHRREFPEHLRETPEGKGTAKRGRSLPRT
ncbi:LuxR C-terminal-related transcriptional regulator [Streptomyces sp. NPDC007346]|uniref:helix-turn-helix transcriptional regulator n=1 Tax=Streptomyces sp. NPDC007346 TaxID=3154682 RepID=UPI003455928A